jgi:hypothetical protein
LNLGPGVDDEYRDILYMEDIVRPHDALGDRFAIVPQRTAAEVSDADGVRTLGQELELLA